MKPLKLPLIFLLWNLIPAFVKFHIELLTGQKAPNDGISALIVLCLVCSVFNILHLSRKQ